MIRILLIEDNHDLAFGLRNNLEIEGYEVDTAEDGMGGLKTFAKMNPDLVILDLMLPEMDGFRVLRSLRQDGHATPVLLLTAKGEEADKVRGLRMVSRTAGTGARFRIASKMVAVLSPRKGNCPVAIS